MMLRSSDVHYRRANRHLLPWLECGRAEVRARAAAERVPEVALRADRAAARKASEHAKNVQRGWLSRERHQLRSLELQLRTFPHDDAGGSPSARSTCVFLRAISNLQRTSMLDRNNERCTQTSNPDAWFAAHLHGAVGAPAGAVLARLAARAAHLREAEARAPQSCLDSERRQQQQQRPLGVSGGPLAPRSHPLTQGRAACRPLARGARPRR